jgi:UDP-N-acetylglucosamine/UDP-N-acetylgalactosamine diphosphorylase
MHNNSLTNYLKAQKNLKLNGQAHLLDALSSLLKEEQDLLLEDILTLDLNTLSIQKSLLENLNNEPRKLSPFHEVSDFGNKTHQELGLDLVKKGLCGALLIAGGQGTRLGHSGPKGTFPITPIYHKSLFQIFAEKVRTASEKANRELPLAIMTSPLNDKMTKNFFEQHGYFGLKKEQLFFFSQDLLPFLNFEGELFLEDRAQIARGPDGNGNCFKKFVQSGLFSKWEELGIQYLNLFVVDNPLADPYDFELFGHLAETQSQVTLKSCRRLSPDEKVGVIVTENDKPVVIEYHEIPQGVSFEIEPAANLSLLALTMDFVSISAQLQLPLHKVAKKSTLYDFEIQKSIHPFRPNCWKFEVYLFDILPYSNKTTVLSYPREQIFCPLKNKEGDFSPQTVRKSLLKIGIE